MNAGVDAGLLPASAYHLGVNVVAREGLLQTRSGFVTAATEVGSVFQGAYRWMLAAGDKIVTVIDGSVRVLDLTLGTTATLTATMHATRLCHFCQVDRWILVQDGVSRPLVIGVSGTGYSESRNPTDTEPVQLVPGSIAAYAHERIHYVPTHVPAQVDANGDSIPDATALDGSACFASSNVKNVLNPEYVFKMTEHYSVDQGGARALPAEIGSITGMGTIRNAATGTGVGALVVFGQEGVSAFDVATSREQWQSVGISQVLFFGASTASWRSVVSVNGDILFMDTEGHFRSMAYNMAAASNTLTNVPISNELRPYVTTEGSDLFSMSHSDNRVLGTFHGSVDGDFAALASLDLAPAYGLAGNIPKLYDGFFTGFSILQTLSARSGGVLTHYVVVRAASGFAFLRLDRDAVMDPGDTKIQSILLTRRLFQAEHPVDVKQLKYVEVALGGLRHDVSVSVFYRPDHYPYWSQLGETKEIAVPAGVTQYRRRVRFGLDYDSALCQDVTYEKLYAGVGFQFMLKVTGFMRVDFFRAAADLIGQAPPECGTDNPEEKYYESGVDVDYFTDYEVPL